MTVRPRLWWPLGQRSLQSLKAEELELSSRGTSKVLLSVLLLLTILVDDSFCPLVYCHFRREPKVNIRSWFARIITITLLMFASPCFAQFGGGGFGRAVGGVMVDADGVIRSATVDERADLLAELRKSIQPAQGELAQATELRMVSLTKLQAAMAAAAKTGQPLPEEMRYLAGLTRIQYVFVYPEQHDVVIAGPAEGWKVREDGSVVGVKSGLAPLNLEDLVVAMRSVEPARHSGISVSIEPTAEGSRRLQQLLSGVSLRPGQNPANLEPAMRDAFGPQLIKLTGVPTDSHFAQTLVAADYQMKRIGMGLDQSPVNGLGSYIYMAKDQPFNGNANPRWWMACNYDPLSHTEDKLAWKLSGQGVKTLTETGIVQNEAKASAKKTDRIAQKWADMMTEQFEALAKAQPIFAEVRGCMDLSVVATLIVQERLPNELAAICRYSPLPWNRTSIKFPRPFRLTAVLCEVVQAGW